MGSSGRRSQLKRLFQAAVAAVHPQVVLPQLVARTEGQLRICQPGSGRRWAVGRETPVIAVGAGKGAALIASELERLLGPQLSGGLVIVPDGYEQPLDPINLFVAGHPLPDQRGVAATRALLSLLGGLGPHVAVIVIITGGASSLMVAPAGRLTIEEKQVVSEALLRSGASIAELNAVRKHLSSIKGGRLGRLLEGHPVLTLVVSDVMGDDPAIIGSGPTVPDSTTFANAIEVLRRYQLWQQVGKGVREHLEKGVRGEIQETPKPGRGPAGAQGGESAALVTMATNDTARRAVIKLAGNWGWFVEDMGCVLSGDTTEAAHSFVQRLVQCVEKVPAGQSPLLFIAGGETTVKVRGTGLGGRNQEFALAAAQLLAGKAEITLLSAGTDGIDGPTDAAGAFADGTTLVRAESRGLDIPAFLARNDSYSFFSLLGDLFKPGPTGVNVMDLKLALVDPGPK